MMNIKKMVQASLLMAIAIIIPVVFGNSLRVYIPPFTATLASHVPMFLAMYLGVKASAVVGAGSAIGFLFAFPDPIVATRAFMHVAVGSIGAKCVENGFSYNKVVLITAPLHGILEALIVIPFGFTFKDALIVVGIGTILHHVADGVITYPILKALKLDKKFKSNKAKKLVA
ncbi:ECF transporter S component [Clostridium ihumii]|uniref:ECF transporter S component n=1 Tax=Clostridium ihumii TaxID=1470356 RepID=UPI003D33E643